MPTLLGIDLGTSTFKASLFGDTGEQLGTVSRPTPWQPHPDGSGLAPGAFGDTLVELVDECVARYGRGPVAGIGVTGMAETIFVETAGGDTLPARAWNDPRGRPPELPTADLVQATGLLDPVRTSAVRLRRLTAGGTAVRSWSGLPEHAVQVLGGARMAERSLAARSGLVDVGSGAWHPELLAWAGVDHTDPPALTPAGQVAGISNLEGSCAGAVLTVAGHDHLTAALGAGADDDTTVFDSLGTGEAVIARIAHTPAALSPARVTEFNAAGFNVGLGLQSSDIVALAGLGTGNRFNLLLTALAAAGYDRESVLHEDERRSAATEAAGRHLHADAIALLDVLFGSRWQQRCSPDSATAVVRRTVVDVATARALWWAGVARASENTRAAIAALNQLRPGVTRLVSAGGWLANPAIRQLREEVLGPIDVPRTDQCGTRGAALLAGLAAGCYATRSDLPIPVSTTVGAR